MSKPFSYFSNLVETQGFGTARVGPLGDDNAVDNGKDIWNIEDSDNLDLLNSYLANVAVNAYTNPDDVIRQIWKKLSIVGIHFSYTGLPKTGGATVAGEYKFPLTRLGGDYRFEQGEVQKTNGFRDGLNYVLCIYLNNQQGRWIVNPKIEIEKSGSSLSEAKSWETELVDSPESSMTKFKKVEVNGVVVGALEPVNVRKDLWQFNFYDRVSVTEKLRYALQKLDRKEFRSTAFKKFVNTINDAANDEISEAKSLPKTETTQTAIKFLKQSTSEVEFTGRAAEGYGKVTVTVTRQPNDVYYVWWRTAFDSDGSTRKGAERVLDSLFMNLKGLSKNDKIQLTTAIKRLAVGI